MTTHTPAIFLCLALSALCAQGADTPPGGLSAPMIRLRSFVEHPRADRLGWVHDEAASLAADPAFAGSVRDLVRGIFMRQWMDASNAPALSFDQFDSLADAVELFGADRSGLVDLVARPGVPAAWLNADFRAWVRRKLPASAGGRW